jgi:MerR family mercuric resistance operon transcriptional regulator
MQIGELGQRSGVKIETIRYYEKVGLIAPPPRSEGGHRTYDETHLDRLCFVRRGRELGFSLEAVRNFLDLIESGHSCSDIQDMASRHLADIQRKIADLRV